MAVLEYKNIVLPFAGKIASSTKKKETA